MGHEQRSRLKSLARSSSHEAACTEVNGAMVGLVFGVGAVGHVDDDSDAFWVLGVSEGADHAGDWFEDEVFDEWFDEDWFFVDVEFEVSFVSVSFYVGFEEVGEFGDLVVVEGWCFGFEVEVGDDRDETFFGFEVFGDAGSDETDSGHGFVGEAFDEHEVDAREEFGEDFGGWHFLVDGHVERDFPVGGERDGVGSGVVVLAGVFAGWVGFELSFGVFDGGDLVSALDEFGGDFDGDGGFSGL